MNIVATFVANAEAAVLVEPTVGAFHNPTIDAQPAAMFAVSFGQHGADAALTELLPVSVAASGMPLASVSR